MLPYSIAELEANRAGRMTATQQERLREQLLMGQRGVGEDITQFGFVLVVVIVLLYIANIPTMITMSLLAAAVLAFGVFKYLETGMLRRVAADVESGRVGQIEGVVKLSARRRGPTAIYRLAIPSRRYRTQIEERVYRTLREGRTYRLYVAEVSGLLLSLEQWQDAA